MAIEVKWKRTPDRQHTGSAELLGIGNPIFLYVHPQDQAQAPRSSPAARWRYNHRDTVENNVTNNSFLVWVFGRVSYRSYAMHRRYYQATPAFQSIPNWASQGAAGQVFGAALASRIQPSGFIAYHAFASVNPAAADATTVKVTANLVALSLGWTTPFARIGGARSTSALCEAANENGPIAGSLTRTIARLRFPVSLRLRRRTASYVLTIPAAGEVMIGKVVPGLGYTISRGVSGFLSMARISYTFA